MTQFIQFSLIFFSVHVNRLLFLGTSMQVIFNYLISLLNSSTNQSLLLLYFDVEYQMSTQIIRPQRSMSYNDIKKRRMLRDKSRSKCQLKSSQASTQIIHTEKKVYPTCQDIYANERPNEVDQIRQGNEHRIAKTKMNGVKDTVKRNITNNFSNALDKKDQIKNKDFDYKSKKISHEQPKLYVKTTSCGQKENDRDKQIDLPELAPSQSRQIVRQIIEETKSERKLILYTNMRNKYKLSKSRSQSKSAKSLLEKSRVLARRLADVDVTPQKPVDNALRGIKNSHRIKRFESVNQNPSGNKGSFRYLVSVPRQDSKKKGELFRREKKRGERHKMEDQIQSSIQFQKQSQAFDSSDDKFLEEICLKPQRSQGARVQKAVMGNENILDLLEVQQGQVSKVIGKKQREKKILKDLQKLNKKFPKGFFKF